MLELRLLNDGDIPLVEVWLNKEHVRRWYEIPHMGITIDDWMHEIKERNGEYHSGNMWDCLKAVFVIPYTLLLYEHGVYEQF